MKAKQVFRIMRVARRLEKTKGREMVRAQKKAEAKKQK